MPHIPLQPVLTTVVGLAGLAVRRLKIGMKEWAAIGLPLGLAMMAIYFFILYVF